MLQWSKVCKVEEQTHSPWKPSNGKVPVQPRNSAFNAKGTTGRRPYLFVLVKRAGLNDNSFALHGELLNGDGNGSRHCNKG